ncbi:MAG: hypothetical protein KDD78_15205, partial [Caldilineaceae bacterium]|nr:hypothetical protein [Caldilineaceae bacterium]
DISPIPLYFNDEMSPDLVGQFDERVPQRRFGTVSQRIADVAADLTGDDPTVDATMSPTHGIGTSTAKQVNA